MLSAFALTSYSAFAIDARSAYTVDSRLSGSEGESSEISGLRHWDLSVQSSVDLHHIVVANAREIVVLRELHQSTLTQVRAAVSRMLSISESPNPRLEKAVAAEVQTLAPLIAELIALILAAQHDCSIVQEKVCASLPENKGNQDFKACLSHPDSLHDSLSPCVWFTV